MTEKITTVIFDLDGTIYSGNKANKGALEIVKYLKNKGIGIFYLTNNTLQTRWQIAEKLQEMGIFAKENEIYNVFHAIPKLLINNQLKRIYCFVNSKVKEELSTLDITAFEGEVWNNPIDAILVGLDMDFDYKKLCQAYLAFQQNPDCKIVICHRDKNYPTETAYRMPGCGAVVAAFETTCERKADFIIGKPDTFMIDLIIKEHNLSKNSICIVGDTEESDIAMAEKANIKSFLLGGNTIKKNAISIKTLSELQDYI